MWLLPGGLFTTFALLAAWDYGQLPKTLPQNKLVVNFDGPQQTPKNTYVFLHGWPDSNALWESTTNLLSAENRCIRIQLPGFLPEEGIWPLGFDEAEKLIFQTILDNVDPERETVTLIGHDWGALLVHYLLLHKPLNKQEENLKNSFRRAVLVDVGLQTESSWSFKAWVLFYQGLNNICFVLPPTFGNFLVQKLVPLLGYPHYPGQLPVTAKMNWPYRAMWKDLLFNSEENLYHKAIKNFAAHSLPIPMLFIWGLDKPDFAQMFDQKYLSSIEATHKLSKSVPMPGGHWLMITHAEEFHKTLIDWLVETK